MKHIARLAAPLGLCAALFLGCATTAKAAPIAVDGNSTPENAVVVIFLTSEFTELVQVNPDYPADRIYGKSGAYYTPPLRPGACYLNEGMTGDMQYQGTACIEGSYAFSYLNARPERFVPGYKLVVPSKPGLYLAYHKWFYIEETDDYDWQSGAFQISRTVDAETMEGLKNSFRRKDIVKTLRNAAAAYAGTAWEPLINEQLEEWSK